MTADLLAQLTVVQNGVERLIERDAEREELDNAVISAMGRYENGADPHDVMKWLWLERADILKGKRVYT